MIYRRVRFIKDIFIGGTWFSEMVFKDSVVEIGPNAIQFDYDEIEDAEIEFVTIPEGSVMIPMTTIASIESFENE